MIFKPYECDFGLKYNGVSYEFTDFVSVQITDPEKNKLTRGSNASNLTGLAYKEGIRDPKEWVVTIMNMTPELKAVFDDIFKSQARCEVYAIARSDGSSKMLKQAILQNRPQQLSVDDSAESMNVQLEFAGYDSSENHKS